MATYIQGVTDYIPQIQPWKPDYNLYQNVLERKQAQYDRGWEQTNSIYNGILNAPMMRADNMETRDKFFKDIQTQIKQLSSVDLSLPQNVDSASQIFKPFYEDENIVHDIGFTKKYQEEWQRSEYLRTCTDKTKCGDKYWSDGQRALQYKAQEFIDASAEDALRIQAPKYTPYVNFMEKAKASLDKDDFIMEYEQSNGQYMVKTKGGEKAIGPLSNYLMARFGNDPELIDYFKTEAYLLRKENPEAAINAYEKAALQQQARSEEELNELVKDKTQQTNFNKAKESIVSTEESEKSGLQILMERKASIENTINNEGILPGSPEDIAYQEILSSEGTKKAAVDNIGKVASMVKNMQYTDENGKKISGDTIDGVVAQALMMNEMIATASTLAYKDYSVTMKVDQYGLASYQNQLGLQRDYLKHQYNLKEQAIQSIFKSGQERRKELIDNGFINPMNGMPYYVDPANQTFPLLQGGGMGIGDAADQAAYLTQQLLQGEDLNLALSNLNRTSSQLEQGVSVQKAGDGVLRFKETNKDPDFAVPYSQVPLTGINQQEDIKVAPDTLNKDERIPLLIEENSRKSGPATSLFIGTNNFIDELAERIGVQKSKALAKIGNYNIAAINKLIDLANDPKNKDQQSAILTLKSIGDLIKENNKDGNIENKLLKDFPTSNKASYISSDYFKKLAESDIASDILFYAGVENVHNLLNGKKTETISRNYNPFASVMDPKIISKEEYINLKAREIGPSPMKPLTDADYEAIKNYEHKTSNPFASVMDPKIISKKEYINLKARETAPSPIKPLTDAEYEAIKNYEYKTSNPKINNNLKGLKLGEMVGLSLNQLNDIGIQEAILEGANLSKDNFKKHMDSVSRTFGLSYNNEDGDPIEKVIAQNIWDKNKGELGKLNNLDNIYNKALEATKANSVNNINIGTKIIANMSIPGASLITSNNLGSSIPKLEEGWLSSGTKIQDKLLKPMLLNSELITDYDLPSNLNKNILNRKNNSSDKLTNEFNQIINNIKGNDNREDWKHFLSLPTTKIVRNGDKVIIESPHLQGGKSQPYDLSSIKVSNDYDKTFEKVYKNVGRIRAKFMNEAQDINNNHAAYLMFPSQFGNVAGNFNVVGTSAVDVPINSKVKNQAYYQFVPLLKEVSSVTTEELKAKGLDKQQGDLETLNIVLNKLQSKPDKTFNPTFNVTLNDNINGSGFTEVIVKINGTDIHQLSKPIGYDTYDTKEEDPTKKRGSKLQSVSKYYIKDANSEILKKFKPNPLVTLLGLYDGKSYKDDSYSDVFGGYITYRRNGDYVDATVTYKYYDDETNSMREQTGKLGSYSLLNTDWEKIMKENKTRLYQIKLDEEALIEQENKITNISYYNKNAK